MSKFVVMPKKDWVDALDSLRAKLGSSDPILSGEVAALITSINGDGGATVSETQTYILITEDGTEIPAVLVEEATVFDATANDIREGKTAVTDEGVTLGTKVIPSYNTREGSRLVPNGSKFVLPMIDYDYTKLQAIICPFNKSTDESVAAERVVINDNVYDVLSTEVVSTTEKVTSNSTVDLGITNNSGKLYLIRYFMYKEIY